MTPKVSVGVLAYRHEAFIEQAIRSILEQRTRFPFEVVIGEDRSPDRTGEIVRRYAADRPDLIRVLPRDHNIGAFANVVAVHAACRGQYLAWLEGDDYWTDPLKLQKQADLLDQRTDLVLCFGNALEFREEDPGHKWTVGPAGDQDRYTLDDLLRDNFVPTCTVMYRMSAMPAYPEWFAGVNSVDWLTYILLAEKGDLGHIPEVFAARRIHGGGMWGGMTLQERLRKSIHVHEVLLHHIAAPYREILIRSIGRTHFRMAVDQEFHGDHRAAWRTCLRHGMSWFGNPEITGFEILKLAAKFCMPWRYARTGRLRDRPGIRERRA